MGDISLRCPLYLCLARHAVYYIRWPIPRTLHHLGKQTWVRASLKTRVPTQALLMVRSLSYEATLIVQRGLASCMRHEEVRKALTDYFTEVIKGWKRHMSEFGRLTEPEAFLLCSGAVYGSDDLALALEGRPQLNSSSTGRKYMSLKVQKTRS